MDQQSATDLLQKFDSRSKRLDGSGPDWLRQHRAAGREQFVAIGLPTSKDEEWRNTNLGPIVKEDFVDDLTEGITSDGAAFDTSASLSFDGPRIVTSNGHLDPDHSRINTLPDGVFVGRLCDAPSALQKSMIALLTKDRNATAFRALNDALFEEAILVHIEPNHLIEEVIEIQHRVAADKSILNSCRNLVVIGERSSATIVERYFGAGTARYMNNCVTDWNLSDGARVKHYRVQMESTLGFHIGTTESWQGHDSHFASYHFDLGGQLSRHNIRATLDGEGGYCDMGGLYVTCDRQHVDNHTVIDHAQPNCGSRELFKGILDDHSRTVFNGRIIVRKDAQKVDAKQSNSNILLSRTAQAHTRPQLEIYADDVKCTHGATVGQLDEDAIFYLRSRGIPAAEARRLMLTSFAGEVLERVECSSLREALEQAVTERLPLECHD